LSELVAAAPGEEGAEDVVEADFVGAPSDGGGGGLITISGAFEYVEEDEGRFMRRSGGRSRRRGEGVGFNFVFRHAAGAS